TEHVFARIRRHNPKINAFVTLLEESALARARAADEARAKGGWVGRLEGLPVLVKDSFMMAGVRTTSGSKQFESFGPKEDAVAVARLRAAGAVFVGKTNLPEFASDAQSYNDIAGTSNNPWDLKRTPGGSTGGGAAALAAGFGFLELGSDIGGSIRTPCHLCGIYGHKPTMDLVPLRRHIPPARRGPGDAGHGLARRRPDGTRRGRRAARAPGHRRAAARAGARLSVDAARRAAGAATGLPDRIRPRRPVLPGRSGRERGARGR